jgi:hypothetical protein
MPVYWRQGLKGRYAVLVYTDPYTLEQSERAMSEIFAHPISLPDVRLLIDRRHCSAPLPDFVRGLVAFIDRYRDRLAGGRAAAVVSSASMNTAADLMERFVREHRFPHTMRTFHDWAEAEAWLQQDELVGEEVPGERSKTSGR